MNAVTVAKVCDNPYIVIITCYHVSGLSWAYARRMMLAEMLLRHEVDGSIVVVDRSGEKR